MTIPLSRHLPAEARGLRRQAGQFPPLPLAAPGVLDGEADVLRDQDQVHTDFDLRCWGVNTYMTAWRGRYLYKGRGVPRSYAGL